jgi:hypothetical protein
MRLMIRTLCAAGALLTLTTLTTAAYADGRNYNDGPVINVSAIRTKDGHFDDYMKFLATTYKATQDAAMKAGLILSSRVLVTQPRGPNDPDIYLVVEYKNWAALDGLGSKFDAISSKVEGSIDKAAASTAERDRIRTLLGSQTMQEALLK